MSLDRVLEAEAFFEESLGLAAPVLAGATVSEHIGNTAKELGISRKNLWGKMRKLGGHIDPYKRPDLDHLKPEQQLGQALDAGRP